MMDLIPTRQVALMLHRSVPTIVRWVRQGRIEPAAKGPGPTGGFLFTSEEVRRIKSEMQS